MDLALALPSIALRRRNNPKIARRKMKRVKKSLRIRMRGSRDSPTTRKRGVLQSLRGLRVVNRLQKNQARI
jgi:hypothetical protein